MKIITIIFILLTSFVGAQNENEKKEWKEGERLAWEDFKGVSENIAGYVASTNSGISFSYGMQSRDGVIKINYDIKTHFYPNASWFKKGQVNEHILLHEQAHFDISELFARKLKMKFASLAQDETFKNKAAKIYKENEKSRVDFQNKFDKETDHSKNIEQEKKWESYIAAQLKEFNDWRN
ncbi:hypothetical protein ULMS_22080 [Patiriisocius marinistellae]|uniref:DUF922 domain-containing protein n=1 Tax=Patiriisocius marinistellae TaxID=2494560 RepID=A0A5J4FWV5_9FLAO|nr:hypothetical protein [Patiriisocius marinistellae]GEQ86700.1 hypothetical protein ULMS_22080 [Patiriisocius marinistellae]